MVLVEMVILIKLQFGFGADFFCITEIKKTKYHLFTRKSTQKTFVENLCPILEGDVDSKNAFLIDWNWLFFQD